MARDGVVGQLNSWEPYVEPTRTGKPGGPSHTYTVKFWRHAAALKVQADSFEIEADAVTFTTDGAASAVVKGSWIAVTQDPDVIVATEGTNG